MKKFAAVLFALGLAGQAMAQDVSPTLKAQVLLDRAHFSVGEIDGIVGSTTTAAVKFFQEARNLPITGELDQGTLAALEDNQPVLRTYTLTSADVSGNFSTKGSYHSRDEKLGELFQSSPTLLHSLNPSVKFEAGQTIQVPAVNAPYTVQIAKIVVTKADSSLKVYDASGQLMGYYPTTLGQDEDVPYGTHKIVGISKNPPYDHVLDGKRVKSDGGPNNPVGNVWMALNVPHYGIHGSPQPDKIAKQQSHGCIRLTNWDANEVAASIVKGAVVEVQR